MFELVAVDEPDNPNCVGYRPERNIIIDEPEDLKEIINIIQDFPVGHISVKGFFDDSRAKLDTLIRKVRRAFMEKPNVIRSWEQFDRIMPSTNSAQDFVSNPQNASSTTSIMNQWLDSDPRLSQVKQFDQMMEAPDNLHIPLKLKLFGDYVVIDLDRYVGTVKKITRNDDIFDGKPIQQARSTASVRHSGNFHKPVLPSKIITANAYDIIDTLNDNDRFNEYKRRIGLFDSQSKTLEELVRLYKIVDPDTDTSKWKKPDAWARYYNHTLVLYIIISNAMYIHHI